MLRVVEDVGGGHVDRLVACTEVRVDILAGVDGTGIKTPLACSAVVVLRHVTKATSVSAEWQTEFGFRVRNRERRIKKSN